MRAVCSAWRYEGALEDAELVVSELVANAVRHAGGSVDVVLEVTGDVQHLKASVYDGSALSPEIRRLGAEEEAGRGLRIVEELALDWGTEEQQEGKRVWVDLGPRSSAR